MKTKISEAKAAKAARLRQQAAHIEQTGEGHICGGESGLWAEDVTTINNVANVAWWMHWHMTPEHKIFLLLFVAAYLETEDDDGWPA